MGFLSAHLALSSRKMEDSWAGGYRVYVSQILVQLSFLMFKAADYLRQGSVCTPFQCCLFALFRTRTEQVTRTIHLRLAVVE